MSLNMNLLTIQSGREIGRISRFIREQVSRTRKEGLVIGLSGGVDSAVAAELCLRALGIERVHALILPEKESQPSSADLALKQAGKMGVQADVLDITPTLEGFRTYAKRDEVIQRIIPGYAPGQKIKMTLPPGLLDGESFNIYTLSVRGESGTVVSSRLKKDALRAILAATNTKQRARMMHLYFVAERDNYLVCGTTNRTEFALGYFVKHGDGGVDIEPIAHLYKAQVYQLADELGVIEEIKSRVPSPDTFSEEVSDEEFYFRIPYETLDFLLYAWEHKIPPGEIGQVLHLTEDRVERAFRDFAAKSRISDPLRKTPPRLRPPRC
jgi:NAD+ synthase